MVGRTETSCGHAGRFGKLGTHITTYNHEIEITNMNWHETRNTQSPLSVTCSSKNPPPKDSTTSPNSSTSWKTNMQIPEPMGRNYHSLPFSLLLSFPFLLLPAPFSFLLPALPFFCPPFSRR